MDCSQDLRKVLAQNIKARRSALHITQAKLAEHADISLPHLSDIERCRTWVSDKTLKNLAKTFGMEAWELLFPAAGEGGLAVGREPAKDQREKARSIADLIAKKREILCHTVNQAMEDLILEVAKEE